MGVIEINIAVVAAAARNEIGPDHPLVHLPQIVKKRYTRPSIQKGYFLTFLWLWENAKFNSQESMAHEIPVGNSSSILKAGAGKDLSRILKLYDEVMSGKNGVDKNRSGGRK